MRAGRAIGGALWIAAALCAAAGTPPAAAQEGACTPAFTRSWLGTRFDASAAFDAARGQVILFGGLPELGGSAGDTWG